MADAEDQTEAPSARRLEKAREEGNVALSRDVLTAVGLISGLAALAFTLPTSLSAALPGMRAIMFHAGDTAVAPHEIAGMALRIFITLAAPLCGMVAFAIFAAGLLQTTFLLRPAGLMPDLSRLSPLKGIKRVIGPDSLFEGVKAVLKCSVFALALYYEGQRVLLTGHGMVGLGMYQTLTLIMGALIRLTGVFIGVQIVIAGLDYFWTHRRRMSKLRMSKQELRDEYKEMEGDPHIKGKIRQIRARRARQRMMEAVKTATVVVTNPTHYAVALFYERDGGGAPKIVAKGADELAARIREVARHHQIPVLSNPPLARALFVLPLETEVPVEHFKVVASIIAYVWRLKREQESRRIG